jgi:hypothetical protein
MLELISNAMLDSASGAHVFAMVATLVSYAMASSWAEAITARRCGRCER